MPRGLVLPFFDVGALRNCARQGDPGCRVRGDACTRPWSRQARPLRYGRTRAPRPLRRGSPCRAQTGPRADQAARFRDAAWLDVAVPLMWERCGTARGTPAAASAVTRALA